MTYKTHVLGGLLLASAVGTAAGLPAQQLLPSVAVSSFASLLPDLDMPRSKASRFGLNRLVAYPLNKLFGHRGFIHSPLLWLTITALLILCHTPTWLWLGVLLGTISHLMLDSLNPGGIPWLWPCKKHFHLANIKTGSAGETVVLATLAVSCIAIWAYVLKGGTFIGQIFGTVASSGAESKILLWQGHGRAAPRWEQDPLQLQCPYHVGAA